MHKDLSYIIDDALPPPAPVMKNKFSADPNGWVKSLDNLLDEYASPNPEAIAEVLYDKSKALFLNVGTFTTTDDKYRLDDDKIAESVAFSSQLKKIVQEDFIEPKLLADFGAFKTDENEGVGGSPVSIEVANNNKLNARLKWMKEKSRQVSTEDIYDSCLRADKWLKVVDILLNQLVPDIQSAQAIINVLNEFYPFLETIVDRVKADIIAKADKNKDEPLIKALDELKKSKSGERKTDKDGVDIQRSNNRTVLNLVKERVEKDPKAKFILQFRKKLAEIPNLIRPFLKDNQVNHTAYFPEDKDQMEQKILPRQLGCIPDLSNLGLEIKSSLGGSKAKGKWEGMGQAKEAFQEEGLKKINALRTVDEACKALSAILHSEKDKNNIVNLAEAAKQKIFQIAIREKTLFGDSTKPEGVLEDPSAINARIDRIKNLALANFPAKYHHANQLTVVSYELLTTSNPTELCDKLAELIASQSDLGKINQYTMLAQLRLDILIEKKLRASPNYINYLVHELEPIKEKQKEEYRNKIANIVFDRELQIASENIQKQSLSDLLQIVQEAENEVKEKKGEPIISDTNANSFSFASAHNQLTRIPSSLLSPQHQTTKEQKIEVKDEAAPKEKNTQPKMKSAHKKRDASIKILAKLIDMTKPVFEKEFKQGSDEIKKTKKLYQLFAEELDSLNLAPEQCTRLSNLIVELPRLLPVQAPKELSNQVNACCDVFGKAITEKYNNQIIKKISIFGQQSKSEKDLLDIRRQYCNFICETVRKFKNDFKEGTSAMGLIEGFERDSQDPNYDFFKLSKEFVMHVTDGAFDKKIGENLMFIDSLKERLKVEDLESLKTQTKLLREELAKISSAPIMKIEKNWFEHLDNDFSKTSEEKEFIPTVYDGIYNDALNALDNSILDWQQKIQQNPWWKRTDLKVGKKELKKLEDLKKLLSLLQEDPFEFMENLKIALGDAETSPAMDTFKNNFLLGRDISVASLSKKLTRIGIRMERLLVKGHTHDLINPLMNEFKSFIQGCDNRSGIQGKIRELGSKLMIGFENQDKKMSKFDDFKIPRRIRMKLIDDFQIEISEIANRRFKELGKAPILPSLRDTTKYSLFIEKLISEQNTLESVVKIVSTAKYYLKNEDFDGSRLAIKAINFNSFHKMLDLQMKEMKIEEKSELNPFNQEIYSNSDLLSLFAKLMNIGYPLLSQIDEKASQGIAGQGTLTPDARATLFQEELANKIDFSNLKPEKLVYLDDLMDRLQQIIPSSVNFTNPIPESKENVFGTEKETREKTEKGLKGNAPQDVITGFKALIRASLDSQKSAVNQANQDEKSTIEIDNKKSFYYKITYLVYENLKTNIDLLTTELSSINNNSIFANSPHQTELKAKLAALEHLKDIFENIEIDPIGFVDFLSQTLCSPIKNPAEKLFSVTFKKLCGDQLSLQTNGKTYGEFERWMKEVAVNKANSLSYYPKLKNFKEKFKAKLENLNDLASLRSFKSGEKTTLFNEFLKDFNNEKSLTLNQKAYIRTGLRKFMDDLIDRRETALKQISSSFHI